jgi:hypothetical protein
MHSLIWWLPLLSGAAAFPARAPVKFGVERGLDELANGFTDEMMGSDIHDYDNAAAYKRAVPTVSSSS